MSEIITVIEQTLEDTINANGAYISNSDCLEDKELYGYSTMCPECGKKFVGGIDYRIYLQPDLEHGAIYCIDCFKKMVELVNKAIKEHKLNSDK